MHTESYEAYLKYILKYILFRCTDALRGVTQCFIKD